MIVVIHVPIAKREQKPIYINDDLFDGTFRRNFSGDYHCTRSQVKSMLRDQTDDTMDMKVLDDIPILDYRETLDPNTRWTDRLQSSSREWSGNVFGFYYRVYNKIIKDIKVPFKTVNGVRIDNTPVHDALREALANCRNNLLFCKCRLFWSAGSCSQKGTGKAGIGKPRKYQNR